MIEKMKTVPSASFVRAFLGHCAQNPGQCERVTKMARAFGTQDLPASMVPLMAPQDQNAQFEGFIVLDGEGAPFLFGVSKGIANGVRMCTCAVANPYANAAEVASTLVEFSGLGRPSLDEATMGQRFRLWSTNGWARGSHISLTDAGPSGLGGVTLGMIAPLAD
ncbi:MAG: hypothetical protein F4Y03_09235 [Alphaproteobacteria bacterium]|nr:hypothetical protein [Alphaproteobacteria bacterium]